MNQYKKYEDDDLFALLVDNNEAAFTELYDRHKAAIFGFAYNLTQSEEIAYDLLQEVFAKIWEYRSGFEGKRIFKSYLLKMTRNFRINQVRKIAKEINVLQDLGIGAIETVNPEDQAVVREVEFELRKAINALPPRQKEVFLLHRELALSYVQIAEKLNLSVSTVENHFSRALNSIRTHLNRLYPILLYTLMLTYSDFL